MRIKRFLWIVCMGLQTFTQAQNTGLYGKDGLKIYLSSDSSSYLKATGYIQVWTRYTDNNPGSALRFGTGTALYNQASTFDVGIRRARFQLYGPLNKKVFFYSQFGMNNFSYLSTRKQGAFFHDLLAEYAVKERNLSIGTGLTGWSGLSRYASPSIASTLMYDAPLYQQATNDVSDQFLRKLSVYAKGKLSKLDYRLALSKPMPVQLASVTVDTTLDAKFRNISVFSPQPAQLQYQGYFSWQFLDEESNLIPYTTGTYLGKKRVFNLGGGFIQQAQAMRHVDVSNEIVHSQMLLWSLDAFFDYALNREKQNALTVYACYSDYDFGPNYIRSLGVMNPMNASSNAAVNKYSGYGNAFPMFGTGNIYYIQGAYLFRKDLLKHLGTLQVYADAMLAQYQALKSTMMVFDGGVNWLIRGHSSKISLNYQNRPVFQQNSSTGYGEELKGSRKGMLVLQFQAGF
ncbi:MAG TPA: hypothetical protein PLQ93_12575 [Bacteroidia bacterium]|nr:hypothetical protein [Bacteroidia bacterium]